MTGGREDREEGEKNRPDRRVARHVNPPGAHSKSEVGSLKSQVASDFRLQTSDFRLQTSDFRLQEIITFRGACEFCSRNDFFSARSCSVGWTLPLTSVARE